jgi:hypothetical protein
MTEYAIVASDFHSTSPKFGVHFYITWKLSVKRDGLRICEARSFPEELQSWDPDPEFVIRASAFVTARYSEFPGATITGDARVPVFQSTKTCVFR